MYSLWGIYKEKLSYLVNQIYLLLQKWNLTLVLQIINIEKLLQSPWGVAQSLTGEQLKALFKWHKSLSLSLLLAFFFLIKKKRQRKILDVFWQVHHNVACRPCHLIVVFAEFKAPCSPHPAPFRFY